MPVSTVSATINITPVVIATFFKHYRIKTAKKKHGSKEKKPTDWILYDEAFHIVRAFIRLGTENTVDSLQAFTNTHVPHPYWATVIPVRIPLLTCNEAADILISWFDTEELRNVVGGERWWQVRGIDGIDAEWIAMDNDVDAMKSEERPMMPKEPQLEEKERKVKSKKRVWAKEDIEGMDKLERVMMYVHGGGYFWGSINTHRYQVMRLARKIEGRCFAVNYRKAPQYPWPCPLHDVFAAYIFLIRPPQNAGHSPISPERIVIAGDSAGGALAVACLTVLRDLGLPLPAGGVLVSPWVDLTHSFPSVLKNAETDILPPQGFIHKPSTLWPVPSVNEHFTDTSSDMHGNYPAKGQTITRKKGCSEIPAILDKIKKVFNYKETKVKTQLNVVETEQHPNNTDKGKANYQLRPSGNSGGIIRSVQVAMSSPDKPVIELKHQIQHTVHIVNLHERFRQLTYPLVSPVLQGSLGGLCPLYIMAGDVEMLRDEVIHLAHRAANPTKYPIREELLTSSRQAENARKYTTPTKVRLQVFDGLCHAGPTVFSFTRQSTYAYSAIADFVRYVTNRSPDVVVETPFPCTVLPTGTRDLFGNPDLQMTPSSSQRASTPEIGILSSGFSIDSNDSARRQQDKEYNKESSLHLMVRERVDVYGSLRPMELPDDLEALQIPREHVGLVKEEPVVRWLAGKEEADAKYKRRIAQIARKRIKLETKAEELMMHLNDRRRGQDEPSINNTDNASDNGNVRRWGPLDLVADNPPPSAIAGRRDTPDALLLLQSYFSPSDFRPRDISSWDALRAALGRRDTPTKPKRQSPAEQKIDRTLLPVHGLSMWSNLMSFFLKKSTQKASRKAEDLKKRIAIRDRP